MTLTDQFERYRLLKNTRPDLFEVRDADCYPLISGGAVLIDDDRLLVLDDRVKTPTGETSAYLRIVSPHNGVAGAAILPIDDGKVILLDNPRHAIGRRVLEIPRGFGDAGETPEECARRELLEELGVEATHLFPLGILYPDTGLSAATVHLFAAHGPFLNCKTEPGVSAIAMSTLDAQSAIGTGSISDAFTIACFFRAKLNSLV